MTSTEKYRWIALLLCSSANFLLNSMSSAFAPILPIIKEELNLSYTEGGMFTTAYFIGYTLGQIPWGHFADKFGGSKAISLSLFTSSIAITLSSTVTNVMEVVLWRFLNGLLSAGIFASGVKVISEWFPPGKRGAAIGVFGAGATMGSIFTASIFPTVTLFYDWRWCVWILATLGFTITVALWTRLRDVSKEDRAEDDRGDLNRTLLQRSFWILGYDQFVRLGVTYGLGAWLPTFFFEYYGLSLVWASMAVTIMNIIGIFSNLVGGMASDRFGETRIIIGSLITLIPCFCILAIAKNLVLAWLLIFLFGWLTNFLRSPTFAILPKLYGLEIAGRTASFQNTFASAGAFLLPFIIGYSRDSTASFSFGWISTAIFCGVGVLLTLLLHRSTLKPN